jgi:hypothetical protein
LLSREKVSIEFIKKLTHNDDQTSENISSEITIKNNDEDDDFYHFEETKFEESDPDEYQVDDPKVEVSVNESTIDEKESEDKMERGHTKEII